MNIPLQNTTLLSAWRRSEQQHKFRTSLAPGSGSICKHCGTRYKLACIVAILPSQEICERLCKIFFTSIFPLIPIIHPPSFVDDFRDFWKEKAEISRHPLKTSSILHRKPGFVSLLASICFSSLASGAQHPLHSTEGGNNVQASDMYFATTTALSLSGFPRRATIYAIAAYIYAQSQFVGKGEVCDGLEFVPTAFRTALGMGLYSNLHRANATDDEQESRRRIWRYILYLDVMESSSSGLSPLSVGEKMDNNPRISTSDTLEDSNSSDAGQFLF